MRIEHATTANRCGRRALPENEAITGHEHKRVVQLQAHESMSARLGRVVTIEQNRCKRVRGKSMEVNRSAMFEFLRVRKKRGLDVDSRHGCQSPWRKDSLAAAYIGYVNAGKVQGHS
jgi:hypothetical protein